MKASLFLYFFHCLPSCRLKELRLIAKHPDWQWLWRHGKVIDFQELKIELMRCRALCKERVQLDQKQAADLLTENVISLVSERSESYPPLLKELYAPPALLYVQGKLQFLTQKHSLAIVGTRRMTDYGRTTIKRFINDLSTVPITIVSGAAFGVDTCAIEASLDHNLPCVAVIGSGVLRPTPTSHSYLFRRIRQEGTLVSEYLPTESATKYHFPERNRIISGLCQGTLVIEAPIKSGALITADFANDQGREVFAVPGPINRNNSQGTNHLIKIGAASLVQSAADICNGLNLSDVQTKTTPRQLNINQQQIYQLIQEDYCSTGALQKQIGLSINQLLVELTSMELMGLITKVPHQDRWDTIA